MTAGARAPSPSVAVIVANHRRSDELVETVRSILAQRYAGVFRVIVVSFARPGLDDLIARLPTEVTVISTDAVTPAAKRNAGLALTDADLVAFCDDDDLWHPEKIGRQVRAMQAAPAAVACCTGIVGFARTFEPAAVRDAPPVRPVSLREIAFSSTVTLSSTIVRGDVIRRLKFDESPDRFGVEDLDLWLRLSPLGQLLLVSEPLTGIRMEATSASRAGMTIQQLRAMVVLAERFRSAPHVVFRAALAVRTLDVASGRPADDRTAAEALLARIFDGTTFGRPGDVLLTRLVRAGWRSRLVAPAFRRLRRAEYERRLRRRSGSPIEYADSEASSAQWGGA